MLYGVRMTAAEEVLSVAQLRADVLSGRARAIRERAHLTQAEVGRAIRASASAVTQWEAGRRLPRGRLAVRYASFLWDLDQATREAP
jgi:DNA-binding transcriptional regulator YiaG